MESVKAASDVYSPVAGEVVAVNSVRDSDNVYRIVAHHFSNKDIEKNPGTVNESPLDAGWFIKLKVCNTNSGYTRRHLSGEKIRSVMMGKGISPLY